MNKTEMELLSKIANRYKAAYVAKQSWQLDTLWAECQDYWAGDVNPPTDDSPGSETNIIQPVIESQVSDLVNGDLDILVKGVGPSDQMFAKDVTQVLKWVWYRNKMTAKLDRAERDRLNLGNVVWKVFWDKDAMGGMGMPAIVPLGPDCFFPDPKITDSDYLQDADYVIQTSWYSRRKLIQMFGKKAQLVQVNSGEGYDPRIFGEDTSVGSDEVSRDQACLYEYWERNDEGKLRLVYCTKDVVLLDSDEDPSIIPEEGNKYPFVLMVGYKCNGRLWGKGDTEQLIPIQNIINDLDDQIRMNARLMGNAQIVVGVNSGIKIKKWTNKPGLKIPAKDHNAWQVVQPPYIPAYINERREKAFYESELVSGRSEVVEGRRSGSLRAASAILALQEAGSRRANHKKLMLQEGFRQVLELVLDYVKEFMTTEQAFDILEKNQVEYLWFRGSDLKDVPILTLNENYEPDSEEQGRERYKELYDEEGDLMTKIAEFDIELHLGTGMPNNKSFLYEATVELHRENIVTTEETRQVLKQLLNWPVIDPWQPEGNFNGRNSSAEQLALANGQAMPGEEQPMEQPVEQDYGAVVEQIKQMVGSGNIDPNQLYGLLNQLPPEILAQVQAGLGGGANANLG